MRWQKVYVYEPVAFLAHLESVLFHPKTLDRKGLPSSRRRAGYSRRVFASTAGVFNGNTFYKSNVEITHINVKWVRDWYFIVDISYNCPVCAITFVDGWFDTTVEVSWKTSGDTRS